MPGIPRLWTKNVAQASFLTLPKFAPQETERSASEVSAMLIVETFHGGLRRPCGEVVDYKRKSAFNFLCRLFHRHNIGVVTGHQPHDMRCPRVERSALSSSYV